MYKLNDLVILKTDLSVCKVVGVEKLRYRLFSLKRQNIINVDVNIAKTALTLIDDKKHLFKWYVANRNEKKLIKKSNGKDLITTREGFRNFINSKNRVVSYKEIFCSPAYELGAFY